MRSPGRLGDVDVYQYSRRVVFRQLLLFSGGSAVLAYFVLTGEPDRLFGSALLAEFGLPVCLVMGVIGGAIALAHLVRPPVSLRFGATEVEVFRPPRRRVISINHLRNATVVRPLLLEPNGLRLQADGRPCRVRYLSAGDRDRVVASLRTNGVTVVDARRQRPEMGQ